MKLDNIDLKIIGELQKSGRESASHIAEKIKVSVPTITERIRKLQENGVILGFQAVLNPSELGLDVSAIITVISGDDPDMTVMIADTSRPNSLGFNTA